MKKILFINKNFGMGGIQSSMINMANELCRFYEVDVLMYHPAGALKERLDARVTILTPSWRLRALGMSVSQAIQSRSFKIILFRLFASVWSKLCNNRLPIEIAIRHQKKMTGYDLAIAYHQEQRKKSPCSGFVRVADRCVEAKCKAAWLHFDSNAIDLDRAYNTPFYQKMDKIVCVSESLAKAFADQNPLLASKTDYCYNFLPYDLILEKSHQLQDVPYPKDTFRCFSACRLTPIKGLVRAIKAFSDTFKAHPELVWLIAGEGPERAKIEATIQEFGLQEQVILLGAKQNPYSYMRGADLLLNTSFQEAAPMVFLESLALGTPVFATRTSSTEEFLNHDVDSFICENSLQGMKEAFFDLIENQGKVMAAKKALSGYSAGNEASLAKIDSFLHFIDSKAKTKD